MIRFERGRGEHVTLIDPQPSQEADRRFLLSTPGWVAVDTSMAVSAFADGRCIAIAGVLEVGGDKALGWALLSRHAGPYMVGITRKVRRVLSAYPDKEILATCVPGHDERVRWLKALGFGPTGETVSHPAYGGEVDTYRLERA